jgi:hypothetical protein
MNTPSQALTPLPATPTAGQRVITQMRETQRQTIGEQIHAQRVARGDFSPPAGSRPAPPVTATVATDPVIRANSGPSLAGQQAQAHAPAVAVVGGQATVSKAIAPDAVSCGPDGVPGRKWNP